jgi:ferric-dicitrate binding protein FerR (iron transport regulator)
MNGQNNQSEFERLLIRLSDNGLEVEELAALGTLIEGDRCLRRQYLEYCQMHALLRSEHGLLTAWSPSVTADDETPAIQTKRFWLRRIHIRHLATAAALFVAVTGIAMVTYGRLQVPSRGAVTAVLSKAVGARFAYGPNGEATPASGTKMRSGLYELRDGLVEIEYPTGAVLVARAPVTFDLLDGSSIRLIDGQLSAHVPPPAKGFRVEAPGATVTDLGTDFGVEAVRDRDSEVHVFHGDVLVDLHGKKKNKIEDQVHLVTGEATRVDYVTGMPSGIDLDEDRFVRSLRNVPSSYSQMVLQMKPAVYYTMEPTGDGTRLADLSGNGADASIHIGKATAPVWTSGKVGSALKLGGPSQQTYASAPDYPQAMGETLSVSCWVYARSRPRWASIAKNWAGGANDRGQFHFGLREDSGELEAHIEDDSGTEITVHDRAPLSLNTWHHVAFVADGSVLRLYRDGVEIDSHPYHHLHRDPRIRALAIGTKLNLEGDAPEEHDYNMWDGNLDELAVFNQALAPEQIVELCNVADESH